MREIKMYCDSCKEDVGESVYQLDLRSVKGNGIMGNNRTPFDLCKRCFNILCLKVGIKPLEKFPNLLK